METNRHYFFVGLFVLLTTLGAMAFAIWVSAQTDKEVTRYQIRFAESVSGLSVGGAVKFRGVAVGSVESITIDPQDTKLISVIISVAKDTPVKTDTVASLKYQGITGVIFVELTGGSNESPTLASTVKKDDIAEIKAKSSPLNAIVDRMPELLERISTGVDQINTLLSTQNISSVSDMISSWQQMSVELSEDLKMMRPMIENVNIMTHDLREITASSKTGISEAVANLNSSSRQFDTLLRDLRKTSRHISGVAEKVEEDPSSLIFPGKEKGVTAP